MLFYNNNTGLFEDNLNDNDRDNLFNSISDSLNWVGKNLALPFALGTTSSLHNSLTGLLGLTSQNLGRLVENYSPFSGRNQNLYNVLVDYGISPDEAEQLVPYQNSYLSDFANFITGYNSDVQKALSDTRSQYLGDNPSFWQSALEGSGTSIGFMGAGALANSIAGPLAGLLTHGASEALAETGEFMTNAYDQGKFNDSLGVSNKNFLTNLALNNTLDYFLGWFSPIFQNSSPNPLIRYGGAFLGEEANELLQEPSQKVIQNASINELNQGDGFLNNLYDSAVNAPDNWWFYAKNLAPEVAASTAITQLLLGSAGAIGLNSAKNNYVNGLNEQVNSLNENNNNLNSQINDLLAYPDVFLDAHAPELLNSLNNDLNFNQTMLQDLQGNLNQARNTPFWNFDLFLDSLNNQNSLNPQPENIQPQNIQPENIQNQNINPENIQPQNLNSLQDILNPENIIQPKSDILQNQNLLYDSTQQQQQQQQQQFINQEEKNFNPPYSIDDKTLNQGMRLIYDMHKANSTYERNNILDSLKSKADFNRLQEITDALINNNNRDDQVRALYDISPNNIKRISQRFFGVRNSKNISNNTRINAIIDAFNSKLDDFYKWQNDDFELQQQQQQINAENIAKSHAWNEAAKSSTKLTDSWTDSQQNKNFNYEELNNRAQQIKTKRPEPGIHSTIFTSNGSEIDSQYRILDVNDVITSHTQNGYINDLYPSELQPRNRERADSLRQISQIANNLKPELLADNVLASNGAPVVGPDLVTESGNARLLALKYAYKNHLADNYKNWIIQNSDKFGFNPEEISKLEYPVLVRERISDVDRVKFTQEANESSIAQMSHAETSLLDASKITPKILSSYDLDKNFLDNSEFIQNVLNIIPKNELATMQDKNGNLSKYGARRILFALSSVAFGNPDIANRMIDSINDNVKNISNALVQASPRLAVLENSGIDKKFSLKDDINKAVAILSHLRSRNESVDEYLMTIPIFKELEDSQATKQLLQLFDNYKNQPNKITQTLNKYVELANFNNSSKQIGLFDNDPNVEKPNKYNLLDAAIESTKNNKSESAANAPLNDAFENNLKYKNSNNIDNLNISQNEINNLKQNQPANNLNNSNINNETSEINEINNNETKEANELNNNDKIKENENKNNKNEINELNRAKNNENKELKEPNNKNFDDNITSKISKGILNLHHPKYDKESANNIAKVITQGLKTFATYTGQNLKQIYKSTNLEFENVKTDYDVKGFLRITEQGQHLIYVTQHADKSTILHESAHMFLDMYKTLAENNLNNSLFNQDWNSIKKWLKLNDNDLQNNNFNTAQEKFARGFEKYIMTGKAPSSTLERAFNMFKNWLKNIYGSISNIKYTDSKTGEKISFYLSKNAKAIYDNLLTRGDKNNIKTDSNTNNNQNEQIYPQINLDPDAPKSKGVTNYKSLVEKNELRQKAFDDLIFDYQSKLGGKLKFKNVRDRAGIIDTAKNVYNGDFSRITDYLSATLTFDDNNKLSEAAKFLTNDSKNITAVRNTLNNGDESGYRQFVASVKLPHGTIGEIILQHRAVQDVHDKIVNRINKNIERLNKLDGMNDIVKGLQDFSKKLYNSAINNTFDQMQDNIIKKIADNTKKLTRAKTHEDFSQILNNLNSFSDFNLKEAQYLKEHFDPYFAPDNSAEKNFNEGTNEDFAKHIQDSPNINTHNSVNITRNNSQNKKQIRENRLKEIRRKFFNAFRNQESTSKESAPAPAQIRPDLKFMSDETESRYNKAKNYKQSLFSKVKEAVKEFKTGFSDANPELASDEALIFANNALKDLGRKKSLAINQGLESFKQNLNGLDEYDLELFGRARMLSDLNFRINDKPDAKLPFGFTKESLAHEYTRFLKYLDKNQNVKNAIQLEEKTMQNISDKFIKTAEKLGLQLDGIFKNPHYYRHIIIDFANSGRYLNGNNSLNQQQIKDLYDYEIGQILNRDYFKKYKGSERDYISNYILANAGVRGQLLADIETMNTLIELKKKYDKMPVTLQQLKQLKNSENNQNNNDKQIYFQDNNNDSSIFDYIPEGYEIFDPASIIHSAKNQTTAAIYEFFNNLRNEKDSLPISEIINTIENIDIKQAQGKMLLPSKLVKSLKHINPTNNNNPVLKLARNITKSWKWWATVSPFRAFRFNVRNFSGDLDAVVAGGMFSAKKFARSVNELRQFYKNGTLTKDLADYIALSGGLNIVSLEHEDIGLTSKTLRTLQNLSDKISHNNDLSKFQKLWYEAKKPFINFNNWIEDRTEEREHWLRYATYLNYKEQIENNNGKPLTYGASIKAEVDNYSSVEQKAFKLSNELLGDYENISETGKDLRKVLVPFYSWIEINAKRYWRLLKNGFNGDNSGKLMKALLMGKTAKVPFYAVNFAGTAAKIFLLSSLAIAFNQAVFPDDDDQLPPDVKYRPHITLGRVGDKILYFDRIGALLDAADWIALDSVFYDAPQIKNGQKSFTDYAKQIISAPFSKALNSLNPIFTAPMEVATKRTIYPDATHPKTISERDDYIADVFGMRNEYRALTGKPGPKYFSGDRIAKYFAYSIEPTEAAYFYILDKVRQFQESVLDKHFDGFASTKRGNALRNLKTAIRYKDKPNIKFYMKEYRQAGGEDKNLKQGMKQMHPLASLSLDERKKFFKWLSAEDKTYLRKAEKFYNKNYGSLAK